MRITNVLASVVGIGLVFGMLARPAQASIFIHEILADPPSIAGDANGDGEISASADEFIEFYNDSLQALDISGWSIADELKVRHVFADNTWVDPMSAFVVFGGGDPNFSHFLFTTASTGSLGLNNSGDAVKLFDLNAVLIDSWDYGTEGGRDQSLIRIDDEIFLHMEIDPQRLFSPGEFSSVRSTHTVPEFSTLTMFMSGLLGFGLRRNKVFRKK